MCDEITCAWVAKDPLDITYHNEEWGKEKHNDQELFEMLILECMQAGLSWLTILKKRKDFHLAFDGFDPSIVAFYQEDKIEELMQNKKIIRNRLKIKAAITNAALVLQLQATYGSFDAFLFSYVGHQPIVSHYTNKQEVPTTTLLSDKISKDLKEMGFQFVGSTIVYAYMQSIGMVCDHLIGCNQHPNYKK